MNVPARRLHHRPGRPTPSGPRPRSMRPNKLKAYLRLSRAFNRVVRAGGEAGPALRRLKEIAARFQEEWNRATPVSTGRFRFSCVLDDPATEGFSSWQTARPWHAAPEETT